MITHTEEKKFKCDKCPATFKYGSILYRHQEHVHLVLKVRCNVDGCTDVLAIKKYLRAHMYARHKHLGKDEVRLLVKKAKLVKI
jgi:hypothetical protein